MRRRRTLLSVLAALTALTLAACGSAGIGASGPSSSGGQTSPATTAHRVAAVTHHKTRKRHRHRHHARTVIPTPTPTPTPTHHHKRHVSAPVLQQCTPLTNGGNCYEPGEFCRNTDHGVSGVAGDGERIRCEDNNGWRWEPI